MALALLPNPVPVNVNVIIDETNEPDTGVREDMMGDETAVNVEDEADVE